MGVNLWGPIYGCKTFAPRMRARPDSGCHIVTTTSTSGVLVGLPNGIYAVTKIAATGLMEQLRVDLRDTNIGTSALIPGITADQHRAERVAPAGGTAERAAVRGARAGAQRADGHHVLGSPAGSAPGGPADRGWHPEQRPVHLSGARVPAGRRGAWLRHDRIDGAVRAGAEEHRGRHRRQPLSRSRRSTRRKWRTGAPRASATSRASDRRGDPDGGAGSMAGS